MTQELAQNNTALAMALLDIVPKILRRLRADVILDHESSETIPVWREMSELHATLGQLTLLRLLVEHKRCMMQELAEHLAVAPSTVTAMVKRLLAQGYVERCRDDVDWRTVWVSPTERGYQAVTVFDHARSVSLESRLQQLSDDERNSLIAALPALRHLVEV